MQLQRLLIMFFLSLVMAAGAYFVCTQVLAHLPYIGELQVGIASAYMWIPGVCALIYMKRDGLCLKIIKKPSRYCLHALLIPLLVVVLGVILTLPFAQFSTEGILEAAHKYHLNFSSPFLNITCFLAVLYVIAAFASVTINFLFALGEELFWRGYLWERVKHLGFWKASLNIGVLWGLWHAPMIILFGVNYPQYRWLGVIWMVMNCVLLTPMLIYLRVQDRSLMAPTILHAMLNAFSPICVVFFPYAHELLGAPLGVAGMLALLGINGYIFSLKRKEISV